jgi:hypothetical protein
MGRDRREPFGAGLERAVDRLSSAAAAHPGGPVLLGVALGAGVIVGGIAVFVVVWAVLVGWFA